MSEDVALARLMEAQALWATEAGVEVGGWEQRRGTEEWQGLRRRAEARTDSSTWRVCGRLR